jgi:hypothetical protein
MRSCPMAISVRKAAAFAVMPDGMTGRMKGSTNGSRRSYGVRGLEGGAAPKGASGQVYVSMIDTNQLNKFRERTQQRNVSLPESV